MTIYLDLPPKKIRLKDSSLIISSVFLLYLASFECLNVHSLLLHSISPLTLKKKNKKIEVSYQPAQRRQMFFQETV